MKKSFLKSAESFVKMCVSGEMPEGSRTFAVVIENGAEVFLGYNGKSNVHFFTLVDTKDPFDKNYHCYPKVLFDNGMDDFMAELERECDYISEIHAPKRKSGKRPVIRVA